MELDLGEKMKIQSINQNQKAPSFKAVDPDLLNVIKKNPASALQIDVNDYFVDALSSQRSKAMLKDLRETIESALKNVTIDEEIRPMYNQWLNKLKKL